VAQSLALAEEQSVNHLANVVEKCYGICTLNIKLI